MNDMYDLIVIGGGSAGCAMAGRLAEDGTTRVLLLEAGGTDRHLKSLVPALTSSIVQNPRYDWCYTTEADDTLGGRSDVWPGGRMLGGGSAINGMMFIRGHAHDYDRWAELGADGWSYADVLPYFRRMEDNERGADAWRGTGGPVSVSENRADYPIIDAWIEAAQAAGIPRSPDLNGETAEGVDRVQVSQRNGMRWSSASAYLHSAPWSRRPKIETDAQVTRIVVENGRAVGVDYVKDGRQHQARAHRGVVLSAGAMNSPRTLMLSGIGPAGHLREMGIPVVHDLPGVGRNLQDHVGTHLVNGVNVPTLNSDAHGWAAAKQMLRFALTRRGILTTAIGHAQAFVRGRPGLDVPNLQISFAAFSFGFDEKGRLVLAKQPSVSTLIGLMRPAYRGHITLRSADPLAPPVIHHRQLSSEDDVEQIVEGIHIARKIMAQSPIAPFVTEEQRPGAPLTDDEALRGYVRMASIPLYHPVGTCRIGKDAMAVVDPELRVHGIDGLWVADASVMPTLPQGNTNATAIMIGDKGADHVLRGSNLATRAAA